MTTPATKKPLCLIELEVPDAPKKFKDLSHGALFGTDRSPLMRRRVMVKTGLMRDTTINAMQINSFDDYCVGDTYCFDPNEEVFEYEVVQTLIVRRKQTGSEATA